MWVLRIVGFENSFSVVTECHVDTDGVMILDRVIDDGFRVPAHQGL